jgi:hypothetical protein
MVIIIIILIKEILESTVTFSSNTQASSSTISKHFNRSFSAKTNSIMSSSHPAYVRDELKHLQTSIEECAIDRSILGSKSIVEMVKHEVKHMVEYMADEFSIYVEANFKFIFILAMAIGLYFRVQYVHGGCNWILFGPPRNAKVAATMFDEACRLFFRLANELEHIKPHEREFFWDEIVRELHYKAVKFSNSIRKSEKCVPAGLPSDTILIPKEQITVWLAAEDETAQAGLARWYVGASSIKCGWRP